MSKIKRNETPKATRMMLSVQATPDTEGIRTAELLGQDHTVIPCIALVEGVLWPANAPSPELALAEEFGRFPEGWNGRPVVYGHPVVDGAPVSASSPDVLKDNAFGQLFNTSLDGPKLKTEIWINEARVEALGPEAQTAIEGLKDGTGVAEVSTGLFTMSESVAGTFDGEDYSSIWRNIVPDHLAVLPEGIVGACSVEDGCGAPRANEMHPVMRAAQLNTSVLSAHTCECDDEEEGIFKRILEMAGGVLGFTHNSDGLSDSDTRTALYTALSVEGTDQYYFILAVYPGAEGSGTFVYEQGFDGVLNERGYSINEDNVALGDESTPVRPETKFVPVAITANEVNSNIQEKAMNVQELVSALIANEGTQFTEDNREWLETLEADQLDRMVPVVASTNDGDDDSEGDDAGAVDTSAAEEDAAPVSTDAYIAAAPDEIQAVLNSGLRMHQARKDELVKGLLANSRCRYTEVQLRTRGVEDLENMAALAQDITFEGLGTVLTTNQEDDNVIPAPPLVFPTNADAA